MSDKKPFDQKRAIARHKPSELKRATVDKNTSMTELAM